MSSRPSAPAILANVPTLDLSPLLFGDDTTHLSAQLRAACEGTAFFYVKNHGVPRDVINNMLDASQRFFAQPLERKMMNIKDRFHRGYLPIGTTQFPGRGADLKDSFDIGVELALDDPSVLAGLPLHGPNQWPELEGFRVAAQAYFASVRALGMKLLVLFARSLEVADDFFVKFYQKPTILMRLMRYPPQATAVGTDSIGATAHTDFGVITVLLQDPGGGLELQGADGDWIAAPHVPDTFVVNLGQLMGRWTNDIYRATPHRVVNRLDRDRFSIPFFFNPDHYAQVACIESCAGLNRPAKYSPVLAGEHIASLVRLHQDFQQ